MEYCGDTVSHRTLSSWSKYHRVKPDVFKVNVCDPPDAGIFSDVGENDQDTDANCDTSMVRVMPPPVTVTVAVLELVPVLAAAVTVIVALPEPDDWDTVSQVADPLLTVQFVLEVMLNVFCSCPEEKLSEVSDTDRAGVGGPACVTLIFSVFPAPVTVTVPIRSAEALLAAAVTVMVALFEPEDCESVSHVYDPLLTVQFVLEVTVNVFDSPDSAKFSEVADTDRVGVALPDCVMSRVFVIPPPLTVMVAVLELVPVLATAVTVTVALPLPEDGDTVSQVADPLTTVQFVFDEIVKVFCSPDAKKV